LSKILPADYKFICDSTPTWTDKTQTWNKSLLSAQKRKICTPVNLQLSGKILLKFAVIIRTLIL